MISPEAGVQHVVEKVQHGAAHSNISQRDPLPNLGKNRNNNASLAKNKYGVPKVVFTVGSGKTYCGSRDQKCTGSRIRNNALQQ